MSDLLYAARDIEDLDEVGNYYSKHVSAMTSEGLHSKSAIAAELGYRDMLLEQAQARLNALGYDHMGDGVYEYRGHK